MARLRSLSVALTAERPDRDRRILYLLDTARAVRDDGLALRAATSTRKKNGEWGRAARWENSIRDPHLLDPTDQTILGLLSGCKETFGYSYSVNPPANYRLSAAAQQHLVPMLCATGRCFLISLEAGVDHDKISSPLVWDDGPAWSLVVNIDRDEGAASYKMHAAIQRDGARLPITAPVLIVPNWRGFSPRLYRCAAKKAEDAEKNLRKKTRNATLVEQKGSPLCGL